MNTLYAIIITLKNCLTLQKKHHNMNFQQKKKTNVNTNNIFNEHCCY